MKTLKQLEQEKAEIEKQIEKLKNQTEWVDIGNGMQITSKQQYNGLTYHEILEKVKESEIADYDLLKKLRREGFKSGWKKYDFLKEFRIFVPNPDNIAKSNGYVARFVADSDRVVLDCYWYTDYHYDTVGVFLIRRKK